MAIEHEEIIGLIDLTVQAAAATIDTIAVHPDHQHRGIGTILLEAAIAQLPTTVTSLDAWTRDDEGANHWYVHNGFTENFRYLHVYKSWDESADGFGSPEGLSTSLEVFAHADLVDEARLRRRFRGCMSVVNTCCS